MEQNDPSFNNVPQSGQKPPKKPMSPGAVVVCVLCGCVMFLGFWYILFSQLFGGLFSALSGTVNNGYAEQGLHGSTIDVIKVEGTIAEGSNSYQHQWTLNTVDTLMSDDQNKGILLYVNSPGGGIYESDELYLKLKEYKEKTNRPVYAYMAQEAASGGLYICMAADKIYANRMTLTGSIGVIMSLTDTTGLQKLIGIKQENITSGKNKAMGNPLTDEQRSILQSMIDESYDIFVDIVAENRHLDKETVHKIADGRVYSAKQAKEIGIVDEIGSYEETVAAIKAAAGDEECEIYEQTPPTNLLNEILYGVQSNVTKQNAAADLDKIKTYIDDNKTPKLMYYMQ